MSENLPDKQSSFFKIRNILKTGAAVFGLSAALLIVLPAKFLELLSLDGQSEPLLWSMRMIGITLVALTGNMWINSLQVDEQNLQRTAVVMSISATSLGVVTLLIPANLNWFSISFAIVGFSFGAAYLVALALKRF